MKLSRERKIFALVCGLALVALVVDRTLLGEAADDALDLSGDGASLLIGRAPGDGATGARGATASAGAPGAAAPSTASISTLLRQMAERNRVQLEQTPDAFQPAAGWDRPLAPIVAAEPAPPAQDLHVEQFTRRKVTSLTAGGRRGAGAMIDGQMIHIGDALDGFVLTSVDGQSALFEGRSVQIRLTLSGEARVSRHSPSSSPASTRDVQAPITEVLSGG